MLLSHTLKIRLGRYVEGNGGGLSNAHVCCNLSLVYSGTSNMHIRVLLLAAASVDL